MGSSKNADFVSSAFGGNQKPHVRSVDRSLAQPSPDARKVEVVEDAKASKEEVVKTQTKAIEVNTEKPSDADKDTFVSKGVRHDKKKKDKEETKEDVEIKKDEEEKDEDESKKEDESEK